MMGKKSGTWIVTLAQNMNQFWKSKPTFVNSEFETAGE